MANIPIKILNYEKVLLSNVSNIINNKLKNYIISSTSTYNDFLGCNEICTYKNKNNNDNDNDNVELSKLLFHSNPNIPWYRLKVNNVIIYEGIKKLNLIIY